MAFDQNKKTSINFSLLLTFVTIAAVSFMMGSLYMKQVYHSNDSMAMVEEVGRYPVTKSEKLSEDKNNNHEVKKEEKEPKEVNNKEVQTPVLENPANNKDNVLNKRENGEQPYEYDNRTKYILMWNNGYAGKEMSLGFGGKELFESFGCEVTDCFVTENRNLLPIDEFDAIMFHQRHITPSEMPERRSPRQRYIMWHHEAPAHPYGKQTLTSGFLNGMFNWTLTYRQDSDFPRFAGDFVQLKVHPTGQKLRDFVKKFGEENKHLARTNRKKPKAAWAVSNCYGVVNNRAKVVKEIEKHIPVDIFGSCGKFQCPREFLWQERECFANMTETYRFYLAFENANCLDYISEKFFKIFHLDMVPVVYGGGQYARYYPPYSFIDIKDFDSAEDLASYLIELYNDDAKYASFFWWKLFYQMNNGEIEKDHTPNCDLCKRLHNKNEPKKVYENMMKWWVNDANCDKISFKKQVI